MTATSDTWPQSATPQTRRWTPVTMATLEADAHEAARIPREAHRPDGWKAWHIQRTVRDFEIIRATKGQD